VLFCGTHKTYVVSVERPSLSPVDLLKTIVDTAGNAQITFLAASVAYYAFVSLIPSLLLLLILASAIGGEAFATQLLELTQDFLTPAGQEVIEGAIENAAGRGGATIVSFAVLAWGTLKVFRALDTAFLTVYGQTETASFIGQLRDAAVSAFSIGVGIASMLVIGAVVAAVPLGPFSRIVGIAILPLLLIGVFLPMYRQFPNPPITFKEALPGAAFAAIGWTALQAGFQIYAAGAAQYQVYGVIGAILLLVTWLYIAAVLIIFGAVVNAVLAGNRSLDDFDDDHTSGTISASDRQLQQGPLRQSEYMASERTDRDSTTGVGDRSRPDDEQDRESVSPAGAPDISELNEQLSELRADLDSFESDINDRTIKKPEVESELKGYVRKRMRRGHARGWGPYLVLLYGTAMTLGAFYYLQSDWVAILAMLIIFLSTLGLYVIFVVVGVGLNLAGGPGRILDFVRDRRN